jgi:DNA invertase Pin-like site-specific DNA recombinase
MRIGYARVSTDDQTLDLQRDALERSKCQKIYEEHASGESTTRPQLEACLKSLREEDTNGLLPGLRRLALVDAKVVDRDHVP